MVRLIVVLLRCIVDVGRIVGDVAMVNYYSQFHRLKSSLGVHTLKLDDFESHLIRFYGFGKNKTIREWIQNFEKAGLIKLSLVDGVWMVELL